MILIKACSKLLDVAFYKHIGCLKKASPIPCPYSLSH